MVVFLHNERLPRVLVSPLYHPQAGAGPGKRRIQTSLVSSRPQCHVSRHVHLCNYRRVCQDMPSAAATCKQHLLLTEDKYFAKSIERESKPGVLPGRPFSNMCLTH